MKFGKTFLLAAVFAAVSFTALSVRAEEGQCWALKPVEKLSRGIANAAFGALELPMKMWQVNQDMGGIAGVTYGTLKGVSYTVAREVVGVIDVATFLVPLPDCPELPDGFGWGYGPIMRPAWVVDVQNDWQNFIFDRKSVVSSAI